MHTIHTKLFEHARYFQAAKLRVWYCLWETGQLKVLVITTSTIRNTEPTIKEPLSQTSSLNIEVKETGRHLVWVCW